MRRKSGRRVGRQEQMLMVAASARPIMASE
jgi:hypothetical protein